MNICLINGSIRPRGVSGNLAEELRRFFPGGAAEILHWRGAEAVRESREALLAADALVVLYGIYFDALPSHLPAALEEARGLLQGASRRPAVYAVANCGYYEPGNNDLSLCMIRHWCREASLPFCGGLSIGAGGGYLSLRETPMGTGEKARLGAALEKLAAQIYRRKRAAVREVGLSGSRERYFREGNENWERAARRRGLAAESLRRAPAVGEGEKR